MFAAITIASSSCLWKMDTRIKRIAESLEMEAILEDTTLVIGSKVSVRYRVWNRSEVPVRACVGNGVNIRMASTSGATLLRAYLTPDHTYCEVEIRLEPGAYYEYTESFQVVVLDPGEFYLQSWLSITCPRPYSEKCGDDSIINSTKIVVVSSNQ